MSAKPSPDRQNGLLRFYKVGDQITLHCNHPDAEMEGLNRLTCTNGGKWNQDLPFCHQLPCSKIPRYFEINCMDNEKWVMCFRDLLRFENTVTKSITLQGGAS